MISNHRSIWLVVSIALIGAGLCYDLAGYPLLDPDEGRNAEIAREMAVSGDFVHPRLETLPYLDKPVLHFAVTAAAIRVLGPTEVAARLPSLAFTVLTLLAVFWFARRWFGNAAGWTAVVATATTPFTLAYSRTVIFDATLTFWIVLALIGFHFAVEDDDERRRFRWRGLAWGAMALGVLTKGPVAIAVPALVAAPYAMWRRRMHRLVDAVAGLLFVALVLPWVLSMERAVPGFLRYALFTETLRRLMTTDLHRTGPWWYFLAILPAAALPWTAVALGGWIRRWRTSVTIEPRLVFLALWIFVPLVFFTLSQSKRPQYILPIVPAFGMAVAAAWHDAPPPLPGARWGAVALAAIGGFLVVSSGTIARWIPGAPAAVTAQIAPSALAIGILCAGAGVAAWFAAGSRGPTLVALSIPTMAIPFVGAGLIHAIAVDRSARGIAEAIRGQAGAAVEVVAIDAFPPSLPFYLRRPVTVVTDDGAPLTSNYLIRNWNRWRTSPTAPIRDERWWRDAMERCTRLRVFVVRADDPRRTDLANHVALLALTSRYAVYGPCGLSHYAARPPSPDPAG